MSDLSNLYSEKVLDHFQNPRNLGEMENPDGVGTVGNRVCGDIMRLFIKVEKKGDEEIVKDVKFQTLGCGAAIATSSMATELIKGKPLSQALELTNKAIADALGGLPKAKIHCSVLAADAVKKAIEDYKSKI
ncbi:Fe-S cluster assembly scaffold protein NifU [Patescibacteria group bacterium]|nr:Fe-S cluster assembly scaffold protein NifU [Patescibacteria group bacterium]